MTYKNGDLITHQLRHGEVYEIVNVENLSGLKVFKNYVVVRDTKTKDLFRFRLQDISLAKNHIVKQIIDDL